jgi:formate/nitrite transporter FocA (FNT family)
MGENGDPRPQGAASLSPAVSLSDASEDERDAIAQQSRPNAALIHETIRAEGESELERTWWALVLSGVAAGLSMGFSLITEGLIQSHLPDAPWRGLVSKSGYTIGFLIVVLGRQQLFTENTLTPILPLLYRRDLATLRQVARLWALVLLANVCATALIALTLAHTSIFAPEVTTAFGEIARHTVANPFGVTFVKAVFAGWLIALMVWLLPGAEGMRPIVIILITYVVALGDFSHIIAGSVDAFYLVATGAATFGDYVSRFFLPTLLGNVTGGVALVAVLNYGQVAAEIEKGGGS